MREPWQHGGGGSARADKGLEAKQERLSLCCDEGAKNEACVLMGGSGI